MGEADETPRLVAWATEMQQTHDRLRAALRVTRAELGASGGADPPGRDLLLFCHGFCTALSDHHRGEDRLLFPALAEQHPELSATIDRLVQDHSMIGYLLSGIEQVLASDATTAQLERHLEGVSAIMESHFRYEERELLAVLEFLDLDAPVTDVYGTL
ncbi:hemerythrin domain-containing protein [Microlunatus sp. Y2014]|uniref:hemerythrin domain-containing protein n=1 Tax=Microlunatus sp. Y2014 TaxID=3418488 RepID=UPI003DA7878F